MTKSRSHEEATIKAFHDDPDFFIRYVRDVLQDLEPRMDRLEAQQATLLEMFKALMTRPPAVPVTSHTTQPPQPTDWKPQYRSGNSTNPWMNQKWSSGATPEMFGMKEKKE